LGCIVRAFGERPNIWTNRYKPIHGSAYRLVKQVHYCFDVQSITKTSTKKIANFLQKVLTDVYFCGIMYTTLTLKKKSLAAAQNRGTPILLVISDYLLLRRVLLSQVPKGGYRHLSYKASNGLQGESNLVVLYGVRAIQIFC